MHQFFSWRLSLLVGENRILSYHVDEALEQINQSEDGAHHLIIYPELRVLRELYTKYIKTQLEHEHKIVLILPHYETADNVRKILFDTVEDAIKNMKMKILLW
jgi:tRNA G37 N-methylase TrmD